jgi:uncharacterized RDD family membrane protein YckC
MSQYGTTTGRVGTPFNPAFDVVSHPALFDGVIGRRVGAFIVDAIIIAVLTVIVWIALLVLGLLTFFLTWLLLGIAFPVVGLGYNALTVGGANQSTIGMRTMGIKVMMWHGGAVTPIIAAFHALLFWVSLTVFCPILLWALFDRQKRCLHDILAGVVLVRDV